MKSPLNQMRDAVAVYEALEDLKSPYRYGTDEYAEWGAAHDVLIKAGTVYREHLQQAENVLHSPRGNGA